MSQDDDDKIERAIERGMGWLESVAGTAPKAPKITFAFENWPVPVPCTFCGQSTKQRVLYGVAFKSPGSLASCDDCLESLVRSVNAR